MVFEVACRSLTMESRPQVVRVIDIPDEDGYYPLAVLNADGDDVVDVVGAETPEPDAATDSEALIQKLRDDLSREKARREQMEALLCQAAEEKQNGGSTPSKPTADGETPPKSVNRDKNYRDKVMKDVKRQYRDQVQKFARNKEAEIAGWRLINRRLSLCIRKMAEELNGFKSVSPALLPPRMSPASQLAQLRYILQHLRISALDQPTFLALRRLIQRAETLPDFAALLTPPTTPTQLPEISISQGNNQSTNNLDSSQKNVGASTEDATDKQDDDDELVIMEELSEAKHVDNETDEPLNDVKNEQNEAESGLDINNTVSDNTVRVEEVGKPLLSTVNKVTEFADEPAKCIDEIDAHASPVLLDGEDFIDEEVCRYFAVARQFPDHEPQVKAHLSVVGEHLRSTGQLQPDAPPANETDKTFVQPKRKRRTVPADLKDLLMDSDTELSPAGIAKLNSGKSVFTFKKVKRSEKAKDGQEQGKQDEEQSEEACSSDQSSTSGPARDVTREDDVVFVTVKKTKRPPSMIGPSTTVQHEFSLQTVQELVRGSLAGQISSEAHLNRTSPFQPFSMERCSGSQTKVGLTTLLREQTPTLQSSVANPVGAVLSGPYITHNGTVMTTRLQNSTYTGPSQNRVVFDNSVMFTRQAIESQQVFQRYLSRSMLQSPVQPRPVFLANRRIVHPVYVNIRNVDNIPIARKVSPIQRPSTESQDSQ